MKLKRICSFILIVSGIFIVLQIAGCGSEGSLYDTSTASITIATSSSSVEADGRSSVTITATVTDVTGSSPPAGTPVNFSTTMGHFANGGQHVSVEIVPGDISQTTSPRGGQGIGGGGTNDGTAQVSLISSTETGTAEITVESLGVTQFAYITFGPTIAPGRPEEITLESASDSITGTESTIITATITPKAGDYYTLVGQPVTFTTTLGNFANGQQSETAVVTGIDGTASVTLFANNENGTATVTSTSGGIPSNTVTITIGDPSASGTGLVASVTLAREFTTIDSDGSTGIQATVTPTGDAISLVGTTVTFSTTVGVFTNGQRSETAVITGTEGIVYVTLFGNGEDGIAVVTATSEGIPSNSVQVTIGDGVPGDADVLLPAVVTEPN